jgi:hypothetical protein
VLLARSGVIEGIVHIGGLVMTPDAPFAKPSLPPPALPCPICGSDATTSTRHPAKPDAVILDCGSCGQTSVVSPASRKAAP